MNTLSFQQSYMPDHNYALDLTQNVSPDFSKRLPLGGVDPQGNEIAVTRYYLTYNSQPYLPVMGEFHFSRFPHQEWERELRKIQAGGVQIVASYIFWIHVEEDEGLFTWLGDNDVRMFVELCQKIGLQVLLRIGPFAHGESRNGGLPDWLYGQSFAVRSNDERYLSYVRRYFKEIAQQIEGQLFKDGGPIIGIQLENEYMHAGAPWEVTFRTGTEWVPIGTEGESHLLLLKTLVRELGLEVPLYSCTAWRGSPVPADEFLPMHGGYAFTPWNPDPAYMQEPSQEFLFRNRHARPLPTSEVLYDAQHYPYACCELAGGTQITYHHRPIAPAECVQAMAIVTLGSGANVLGYYMYHGGSNPIGKHSYLNEFTVPRISYDFQAPVREYGQLNESYHRLRTLHLFLQACGTLLAPLPVILPEGFEQLTPENVETLRYAARGNEDGGFFFLNNYQDHVEMHAHKDVHFHLTLPGTSLVFPQYQILTVPANCSAIFPFHLALSSEIKLLYATAQLLTVLRTPEETTYVFFAPDGMSAEFAFDQATYHSLEVTGGEIQESLEHSYILAEPGLHCHIDITALDGKQVRVLVLTQEVAWASWKIDLWGQERLAISEALVLSQESGLSLSWRGQAQTTLALYPPISKTITATAGEVIQSIEGLFTRCSVTLPPYQHTPLVRQVNVDTFSITLSKELLTGVEDLFLSLEYVGDMGHAYLDGKLISDHFANGLPWEIGLQRYISQEKRCELVIHLSPLRSGDAVLRYFPTGMAFRPTIDDIAEVEVRSLTLLPQYHSKLALFVERPLDV